MNFGAIGYARSFNDLPVMPDLAFEAKVRTFLSSLRDGSFFETAPPALKCWATFIRSPPSLRYGAALTDTGAP
jgi:hypothetical protein